MARARSDGVVLSGVGACTCLGGAVQAAAAARASVVRPKKLDDFNVIDPVTNDGVPLTGHPVDGITNGFQGRGRLLRMGVAGLHDLLGAAPWLAPARTPLFLALPRTAFLPEEPEVDDDGIPIRSARPQPPAALAASVGDELAVEVFGEAVASSVPLLGGAASALLALQAALSAINERQFDAAIVGACDSALDEERLAQALSAGRLKHEECPVGYMPGEGAAFLLIERRRVAEARAEGPAPLLGSPLFDTDTNSFARGLQPSGTALARVAAGALSQIDAADRRLGTVFNDLNGEPFRSADWGHACVHLRSSSLLDGWSEQVPALSFGETGTAGPLLALVLATRAFARGYATGDTALVLSSDDDGARGAVTLQRDGGA